MTNEGLTGMLQSGAHNVSSGRSLTAATARSNIKRVALDSELPPFATDASGEGYFAAPAVMLSDLYAKDSAASAGINYQLSLNVADPKKLDAYHSQRYVGPGGLSEVPPPFSGSIDEQY